MRQQHAHGDGHTREVRIAQRITEIVADIYVERENSVINETHHAQRRDQFGNGSDAIHRVGIGRLIAADARRINAPEAELPLVNRFAVANRQHRQARQRMRCIVDNGAQPAIKQALTRLHIRRWRC